MKDDDIPAENRPASNGPDENRAVEIGIDEIIFDESDEPTFADCEPEIYGPTIPDEFATPYEPALSDDEYLLIDDSLPYIASAPGRPDADADTPSDADNGDRRR